jgi:peptidoglycan/xylan/chitin deacetylase (PgdA/CDA1 family)
VLRSSRQTPVYAPTRLRINTRKAKSVVGNYFTALGLHSWLLRDRGVVVAFHRVNDAYQDSLTCSVKTFESFCRFFRRYFTVVPLPEMVRRLGRGEPVSRSLAITFDDGYRDNFEFAAPILSSLGLPATFFVVSDFLETNAVPPWDRGYVPAPAWMTWNHVRELHARGFEIGGHTRTHVDLGEVTGRQAEWEIAGSRHQLEDRLGAPVTMFAYPFGGAKHITESNRELVRQAGFLCCASCYGGSNPRGSDVFRLLRVPISSWFLTPAQFALEVALRRA